MPVFFLEMPVSPECSQTEVVCAELQSVLCLVSAEDCESRLSPRRSDTGGVYMFWKEKLKQVKNSILPELHRKFNAAERVWW